MLYYAVYCVSNCKRVSKVNSFIYFIVRKILNHYTSKSLLFFQFIVVKFINEDVYCNEEDDSLFEVGLTKWLKQLDKETNTKISWPPKSEQSTAIKKEADALPSWPIYNVTVLKFYGMLFLIVFFTCKVIVFLIVFPRYTFGCTKCTKWIYYVV